MVPCGILIYPTTIGNIPTAVGLDTNYFKMYRESPVKHAISARKRMKIPDEGCLITLLRSYSNHVVDATVFKPLTQQGAAAENRLDDWERETV